MEGEYVEEKRDCTNMFSKIHQTQKFQPHHQPLQLTAATQHHFQLALETQTSEEADSLTTRTKKNPAHNDGATIEVVRRPRGRPPGSKNKPKPPVIITRDTEPSMSPYVLELPGGSDIIDSISSFCRRRNTGLSILTGSGTVANVTLRQPSTTPGATITFHGRFDLLSISGTIIPSMTTSITAPFTNGFTISLAGPQGQIVGGAVVGSLMAASTVHVIAASFNNPSYHRLPVDDEVRNSGSGGNEGGHHSPSAVSGGGDTGAEACGMSIYNCHMPSDVVWAPTARQPPPPPRY